MLLLEKEIYIELLHAKISHGFHSFVSLGSMKMLTKLTRLGSGYGHILANKGKYICEVSWYAPQSCGWVLDFLQETGLAQGWNDLNITSLLSLRLASSADAL